MKLPPLTHLHDQETIHVRQLGEIPTDHQHHQELERADVGNAIRLLLGHHARVCVDDPRTLALYELLPLRQRHSVTLECGALVPLIADGAGEALQDTYGGCGVLHVIAEQKGVEEMTHFAAVPDREGPHRALLLAQTAHQQMGETGQMRQQLERRRQKWGIPAVQRVVEEVLQRPVEPEGVSFHRNFEDAQRHHILPCFEQRAEKEVEDAGGDGLEGSVGGVELVTHAAEREGFIGIAQYLTLRL